MSRASGSGAPELAQALEALQVIIRIRDDGRSVFDSSEDRRLAAAFCWANVGSALKQFCRVRGIGQGTSPFPGPIRMRDKMLYQRVDDLSTQILWDTCVNNTDALVTLLHDLRKALEGLA